MQLTINNVVHNIDVEPNMPLLWAIREVVGLTGTKYGCGIAQCGACSVYLNGELTRSCSIPVSAVGSMKITTIEALSKDNSHPVQKAWIALDVPQCGYCQSGQVMAAAALLKRIPKPTDADIDNVVPTKKYAMVSMSPPVRENSLTCLLSMKHLHKLAVKDQHHDKYHRNSSRFRK